jgi:hypothetical protein
MLRPHLVPTPAPTEITERPSRNWPLRLLYATSFALLAYSAWFGWDYYSAPLMERAHHPQYWTLKPGGSLGRTYGVIGVGLMTLMMSYSVRKRFRRLRKLGSLRSWLDFHIYCGVVGPLFIVLHSSLKVTGVVALSFWSMVVVATSGIVGRYLYLQIPRRRSGDEMTLADVQRLSADLNERLLRDHGVSERALQRVESLAGRSVDSKAGLFRILLTLPFGSARLQWHLRAVTHGVAGAEGARLRQLLRERAQLSRRILLWEKLQALFHHWHVLHKPFAVIMYLFAAVHIGVAIATGYAFGP